jgi:hypothetical protein
MAAKKGKKKPLSMVPSFVLLWNGSSKTQKQRGERDVLFFEKEQQPIRRRRTRVRIHLVRIIPSTVLPPIAPHIHVNGVRAIWLCSALSHLPSIHLFSLPPIYFTIFWEDEKKDLDVPCSVSVVASQKWQQKYNKKKIDGATKVRQKRELQEKKLPFPYINMFLSGFLG